MDKKTIGVFVGSIRKESFSRKIAELTADMFPESFEVKMMDISNLSIFNQDYDDENRTPEQWVVFRNEVSELDGYLFVTPEYNRSLPPLLKNAIDIASRPGGENRWGGKPAGILSVSPGAIGGFGANHHLRQILTCLNVYTMPQPEMYIGNVSSLLNNDGTLKEERTKKYIQNFADTLSHWIINTR